MWDKNVAFSNLGAKPKKNLKIWPHFISNSCIGRGRKNFIANRSISASPVSLKLLIDKKRKKVLFAEAGKDFADFLFTLLSLPVSTVIGLLSRKRMICCLGKLYGSLENLNDTYLQPNLNKDPSSYSYSGEVCYVADDPKAICPKCHNFISKPTTYVARLAIATSGKGGGFVREAVTYMITDDMEVKPMSAISSIALLQNFDVRDVRSLEEIVVPLDKDKGLKLLKDIIAVKCSYDKCVPLSSISS
ncbi:unnamed protein product [Prunus armeniaca]